MDPLTASSLIQELLLAGSPRPPGELPVFGTLKRTVNGSDLVPSGHTKSAPSSFLLPLVFGTLPPALPEDFSTPRSRPQADAVHPFILTAQWRRNTVGFGVLILPQGFELLLGERCLPLV